MKLQDIVYAYSELFTGLIQKDYSNNGLQIEASEDITKVAFAVDACAASLNSAADCGAQLLVVHHGISWGDGFKRLTGAMGQRAGIAFRRGVSLYGMHLPLDMHPTIGNNAVLADMLSLQNRVPFFECMGAPIGISGELPTPMTAPQLADCVGTALAATATVAVDNGRLIRRLGIVSGSGGSAVADACECGLDALLTGEFHHQDYHPAMEESLSVISAGHYATETTGIRKLCDWTRENLSLDTEFIDLPTGL